MSLAQSAEPSTTRPVAHRVRDVFLRVFRSSRELHQFAERLGWEESSFRDLSGAITEFGGLDESTSQFVRWLDRSGALDDAEARRTIGRVMLEVASCRGFEIVEALDVDDFDYPTEPVRPLSTLATRASTRHGEATRDDLCSALLDRLGSLPPMLESIHGGGDFVSITVDAEVRGRGAVLPEGLPEGRVPLASLTARPGRRWSLLGDPGAGKTTALRRLATRLLRRGTVAFYAKAQSLVEGSLATVLGADLAAEFRRAGARRKVVILVDGLDEVANVANVARRLEVLHRAYPRAVIVVASRPVGFENPPGFHEVVLCPLSWAQQSELLGQILGSGAVDDVSCIQQHLASLPWLQELATNPLLLTLVGLLYREGRRLPHRRVDLYADAVELLFTRGTDASAPHPFGRLGWQLAADALGWLVIGLHAESPDAIPTRAFVERSERATGRIQEALTEEGGVGRFLEQCAFGAGILVPDGATHRRSWTFSHRTFREYLMASMFVKLRDQERVIQLALQNPALWGETLALATGLMRDANAFVRQVAEKRRGNSELVYHLLAYAEGISEDTLLDLLRVDAGPHNDRGRARVLRHIHTLVPDPWTVLRIGERLWEMVRSDLETTASRYGGGDLLTIDLIFGGLGRSRQLAVAARARKLRRRVWSEHRPSVRRSVLESLAGERSWLHIERACHWGLSPPEDDHWDDPSTVDLVGKVEVPRSVWLLHPSRCGMLLAEFDGPPARAEVDTSSTRLRAEALAKWLGEGFRFPTLAEYRVARRRGLVDVEPWLVNERGETARRPVLLVKRA